MAQEDSTDFQKIMQHEKGGDEDPNQALKKNREKKEGLHARDQTSS